MGKMNIILIIIIVVLLGGGGYLFFMKPGEASEKGPSAEELAELSVDTDIITTNLATPDHFGIVQFNIQLSSKKAKEETEKRTPEVRAAIISTVAGMTKEKLVGKDGIAELENDLYHKLNEIVEEGKVERVLVTEFKVQ
jgi:flagellar protein FliL